MILGFGQVGQALHSILGGGVHDPDKGMVCNDQGGVLNVCIPYSDKFVESVKEAIVRFKPDLTIIHSTVKVGTTRQLGNRVVYSFVRGKHPNLKEMIHYRKHIGAIDPKDAIDAEKYLKEFGFVTQIHYTPEAVEFGKLFDTTYYGVCLAFIKEAKKWADEYGIDWNDISEINRSYNSGVTELGHSEWRRPDLIPMPGGFNGHCVLENSIMLHREFPKSKVLEAIIGFGKGRESIKEAKPYLNYAWLYSEYVVKERSTNAIGKENGCTGENIIRIMKRMGIKRRTHSWTENEIKELKKLSSVYTFKEISEKIGKTHDAVRMMAIKLGIDSIYNPGVRNIETRKKISCTLQGINIEEWDGFKEAANQLIRKSESYQEWRGKVFARDEYKCQRCGKGGALHAHHIKEFSKYPELRMDVDNGITYCVDCHIKRKFEAD